MTLQNLIDGLSVMASLGEAILLHPFTMLFYGLMTNFGRKSLAAVSHQTGTRPSIRDYWREHPMQSLLSVIGSLAGYSLLVPSSSVLAAAPPEIITLARASAFGVGFMADNIADAIGESTLRRIPMIGQKADQKEETKEKSE